MNVYPRNLIFAKRRIKANTCFVLMPFSSELMPVYEYLSEVLNNMGIKTMRSDSIFESKAILTIIVENILSSEFIIADMTQKNTNVFYEIGLSHVFRDSDNVILICQSIEDVPFDLRHLPILIYGMQTLSKLKTGLHLRITNARKKNKVKDFILHFFSDSTFNIQFIEETMNRLKENYPQFDEDLYLILNLEKNDSLGDISLNSVIKLIDDLDTMMSNSDVKTKKLLRKIKLTLSIEISKFPSFKKYCLSILKKPDHQAFVPTMDIELNFAADFAFELIDLEIYKNNAIDWIFQYMKHSRVGGVDVTRNKIDEFLIQTEDKSINSELMKLLKSDNQTLRESSVDILTQKLYADSITSILSMLKQEKNIYVVRSIITGLQRFKNKDYSTDLINWFRQNHFTIKKNNAIFLCEVAIEYFEKKNRLILSNEISKMILNFT